VLVSSGEPAGVGPDLCVLLARRDWPARICVLGDPRLLAERARQLAADIEIAPVAAIAATEPHRPGRLAVLPVPLAAPVTAGQLDVKNSHYVLEMLRRAARECLNEAADALVTAPVQKSILTAAGAPFSGHTEFLAELTGGARPVMLLASKAARVALATTHLPLRAVPGALTAADLEEVVEITVRDLSRRFGIDRPRVVVLGMNPHAGESGTLGDEEQTIIGPAIRRLAARGLNVTGPVSADTAFTADNLRNCDVVVAMYHDQGLPALKALSFGEVVNVTLGLPIIRTSVDHGTALALAGTGRARPDSLYAAVELAIALAERG
jgi:4-hydroxythreonine-4-phosphate dehydrogenase